MNDNVIISMTQVLSARGSAADQNEIMEFFKDLVDILMDRNDNLRLDLLACPLSANNEGMQVIRSLEEFIKVITPITLGERALERESSRERERERPREL